MEKNRQALLSAALGAARVEAEVAGAEAIMDRQRKMSRSFFGN
jgi:hypothetical protein